MAQDALCVLIEGEPFLSRVIAHRAETFRVTDAALAFGRAYGASNVPESLHGLYFTGGKKPPAGWTKPDRKGWSKPKKGSPDAEKMAALPRPPRSRDVFGDAVIEQLSYKYEHGQGFSMIGGFFFGPRIGWFGDTFYAWIPDPRRAVARLLKEHPDATITNGADTWSVPDGLREVSEAEIDLLVATYKVEQERAAKSKDVS